MTEISMLESTTGKDVVVVGVAVSITESLRAYRVTPKDALLWRLAFMAELKTGKPLLEVAMPCGKAVVFQTADDLPQDTLMCPCGNPKHYIIKYTWID